MYVCARTDGESEEAVNENLRLAKAFCIRLGECFGCTAIAVRAMIHEKANSQKMSERAIANTHWDRLICDAEAAVIFGPHLTEEMRFDLAVLSSRKIPVFIVKEPDQQDVVLHRLDGIGYNLLTAMTKNLMRDTQAAEEVLDS